MLKRTYQAGDGCELVGQAINTDFYKLGNDGKLLGVTPKQQAKNPVATRPATPQEQFVSTMVSNTPGLLASDLMQTAIAPKLFETRQYLWRAIVSRSPKRLFGRKSRLASYERTGFQPSMYLLRQDPARPQQDLMKNLKFETLAEKDFQAKL